ncbi:MAG: metallophosphoesterase [Alphaproteobacteria bacterium]|nr:metallophosphoesterase [Alphaproteobacteria bacterium]
MRIVHLTDLHVQTAPRARDLLGKRLVGSANLYLMGRRRKFDRRVQEAAVAAAVAEAPDAVVVTGDLTAQALDSEFAEARQLLDPLLSRFPTVLIPGNHDTYVRESAPGAKMLQTFAPWMGGGLPYLEQVGDVAFLAVETCRSHPLSSGRVPAGQLDAARRLLDEAAWADGDRPFVFLLLHYPLRNRHGGPYGPATRALSNADQVEAFLRDTDRIDAVLHGHEHHGFRTTVPTAAGDIPILDPGASGYSLIPDQDRTAHFNIYDVDRSGLHQVWRKRWDGASFVDEPGGAYQTGR